MRELHWHPTADEWQYVIDGDVSVTMFGSHGRYRTETLSKGDVGYIPQGYGHSIENVGSMPCRVLIGFNTGVYETIDLSQWIAGNPADVLATNFGKPPPCSKNSRATTCSSRRNMARIRPDEDRDSRYASPGQSQWRRPREPEPDDDPDFPRGAFPCSKRKMT